MRARDARRRLTLTRCLAALCLPLGLIAACAEDAPQATPAADTSTAQTDTSAEDTSTADTPEDTPEDVPDTSADADLPPDTTFPYARLSTYGLFVNDATTPLSALKPATRVIPYAVNAVLFADDSEKARFLYVPEGAQIGFNPTGRWAFPEGTILVKGFFYWRDARDPSLGRRHLETRLLVLRGGIWRPLTYVWDEAQTEATRLSTGADVTLDHIDAAGQPVTTQYLIPNNNQCKNCHDQSRQTIPLGPITRQLNRDLDYGDGAGPLNQLTKLEALGWLEQPLPSLDTLPLQAPFTDTSHSLEARARSYLDVNCSHCHNPDGSASSTGLNLSIHTARELDLGVCRRPFSAGRGAGDLSFDIVPGDPDASIMVFRMTSTDPEIKMPELPTRTADATGAALIRAWIAAMPPRACE